MRLVLDASVAVAAARPAEPTHAAAKARVDRILARTDTLVVPALFRVEVASALTRAGWGLEAVSDYVQQLVEQADVVTMGPKGARMAQAVAMVTRLRAGDATYLWVARRENVPLVTSDKELLARAGGEEP